MTFWHIFFLLDASEAEYWLGLEFFKTRHCDPIFSKMKSRFNPGASANVFHRKTPVHSWHYLTMRIDARGTTFKPSGHEAITSGKIEVDDHYWKKKASLNLHNLFATNKMSWLSTLFQNFQRRQSQHVPSIPKKIEWSTKAQQLDNLLSWKPICWYVCPERWSHGTEKEAVRSHLIWPQKRPPSSKASSEWKFPCEICAVTPRLFGCFLQSEWDIGKCDFVQHTNQVYPGSTPVKFANCRMPMHFRKQSFHENWTNSLSIDSFSHAIVLTVQLLC